MMPTEKFLPDGACPTTEPRAGGHAPAAGLAAGDAEAPAAGDAAAAGLGEAAGAAAAGDAAGAAAAGEAAVAGDAAGAAGFGASVGLAGALVGEAAGADGPQAAIRMPDQASSTDRRVKSAMRVLLVEVQCRRPLQNVRRASDDGSMNRP